MTGSSSKEGSDDFDADVFISYTHVDNLPFGPKNDHWVTLLDQHLSYRLKQLVGKHASVWRDPKIQGNDVFSETVSELLKRVRALVAVASPGYLQSDWCRRELAEFVRSAVSGIGVQTGTKSRIFKVVKTPVPLDDLPPTLEAVLGYEFYEETEGDHFSEYLLSDESKHYKFYTKADLLAQDIAKLLAALDEDTTVLAPTAPLNGQRTVYLALATSDVTESRDGLKRELERRGHRVVPDRILPAVAEDLVAAINDELSEADLAVHLLGARYGIRPEGEERSIPSLQLDLAGEFASRRDLDQLIWTPEHPGSVEAAQAALIDRIATANGETAAELFRGPLETFKAYVLERLAESPTPAAPSTPTDAKRVYLVYVPEDREPAAWLQKQLEELGYAVMLPLSEGSEAEVREVHEQSMVHSHAVLIYHGRSTEYWVRMKLFDLLKARGWGRTEPLQAAALWLGPPPTEHKSSFRSVEAMVLNATQGHEPSVLDPFLAELDRSGPDP